MLDHRLDASSPILQTSEPDNNELVLVARLIRSNLDFYAKRSSDRFGFYIEHNFFGCSKININLYERPHWKLLACETNLLKCILIDGSPTMCRSVCDDTNDFTVKSFMEQVKHKRVALV